MQDRFTIFIDESGEAGIEKVRSASSVGASPYMTLGASLIGNRSRKAIEDTLDKIGAEIGKSPLHCSQLKHYQLLHFVRQITQQKMRLFGVISRKATLGSYKAAIADDSSMYYNKCAQYLLERVGWFMEAREILPENLDIIFEKANVDYERMRNLLWTCQSTPKHPHTKKLQHIDIRNIAIKKKSEEPLLQLADLVAHALYKCVDKQDKNFGIPEPRYLRELAPHFFGHPETQSVVGAGLYCVHSTRDLKLASEVEEVFNSMVANHP
ncbi:DUF3800 domain-containing protein [Nitratireductor sp. GCM10026969]|uniref:DUF3800 domain-containing protein n=1 Tax=Nitratireductor sp. GCM10026969 TaxID=3252645 RepID=UPI003608DFBD